MSGNMHGGAHWADVKDPWSTSHQRSVAGIKGDLVGDEALIYLRGRRLISFWTVTFICGFLLKDVIACVEESHVRLLRSRPRRTCQRARIIFIASLLALVNDGVARSLRMH